MHSMTQADLEAAFAGESQAHVRYMIYADQADKEGLPEAARLFRAISYAERVHATAHLRALGKVGKTAENLAEALGGETYEVDEMYPAFISVAETQRKRSHSALTAGRWKPRRFMPRSTSGPGRRWKPGVMCRWGRSMYARSAAGPAKVNRRMSAPSARPRKRNS